MSSLINEQYFGSITRLTTYQSVLLFTSVSSPHPPHVGKDEGSNKGISGGIYISTAVMVLLVTVVVIVVVIVLAFVLQQRRSKKAIDVQSVENPIYAGI